YSLSHVALPFPMNDSLYGLYPDPAEDFGIHLGALAPRGERNVLIVSMDMLLRISFNPFFPYMLGRIEEGIVRHASSTKANSPAPGYRRHIARTTPATAAAVRKRKSADCLNHTIAGTERAMAQPRKTI